MSTQEKGLSQAEQEQRALAEFSEKLAQAYEENNIMFRLAGLVNSTGNPLEIVYRICGHLMQMLPFGWLIVCFNDDSSEVPELQGQIITKGPLPCKIGQVKTLVRRLLGSPGRPWQRLIQCSPTDLSASGSMEILAEPIRHDQRLIGCLLAGDKCGSDPAICSNEMRLVETTAGLLGIFHENRARFAEQKALFTGMLEALTASIDAKDGYTCGHSERVGQLAVQLAAALGLDSQQQEQYRIAGLLHDVGKIGVPEAVLCKTGNLSESEYTSIRRHPEIGFGILKEMPAMGLALDGILYHHERWDGQGYPRALAGESIPMVARVLALADAFDAMSSTRSYRPAMPRSAVLGELHRCAGTQFDPTLVPLFVGLDFAEFDRLLGNMRRVAA